jgi:predicted Rossmann fold flavoprotein
MEKADVIVIGAGAAGCFGAIQAAIHFPNANIVVLERGKEPLAKVRISGGGRCNVTNVLSDPSELSKAYPRGERFLKKAFYQFSSNNMKDWLAERNIPLTLYPDGCYFPTSNSSETIIACFLSDMKQLGIRLLTENRVETVEQVADGWCVKTQKGEWHTKSVLYTIGGQPKISGFNNLQGVDLKLIEPLPSLFTFNMPNEPIRELMGIVIENAAVKIQGEKWNATGPLLITHWGMSGPAVLKCSAYGARILAEKNYKATILVNWTGDLKLDEVSTTLLEWKTSNKFVANIPLFAIKTRLWEFILEKSGISKQQRWSEIGPKQINKLAESLVNDTYTMSGKTTFKEEFVTAGGIDLNEINVQTMEAKRFPGLFFAGEAMDIDGITGGFNFQAAWTTAFIAGKSILTTRL